LFLEEITGKTNYSMKECKQKQKKRHRYKIGTWNVRTLNKGGKLENLKGESKECGVSSRCLRSAVERQSEIRSDN
jgi:hypothetical protein